MIGKTKTGKLYHITNNFTGGGNFSLCGCILPSKYNDNSLNAHELKKQNLMCEKCMNIRYYNQSRD